MKDWMLTAIGFAVGAGAVFVGGVWYVRRLFRDVG